MLQCRFTPLLFSTGFFSGKFPCPASDRTDLPSARPKGTEPAFHGETMDRICRTGKAEFVIKVKRKRRRWKSTQNSGAIFITLAPGSIALLKPPLFLAGHDVAVKILAQGKKQQAGSVKVDSMDKPPLDTLFPPHLKNFRIQFGDFLQRALLILGMQGGAVDAGGLCRHHKVSAAVDNPYKRHFVYFPWNTFKISLKRGGVGVVNVVNSPLPGSLMDRRLECSIRLAWGKSWFLPP